MSKKEVYKVSASLINSYLNMLSNKYEDSAEQFINTLKRIPIKDNYAIKRGNAFEDAVTKFKSEPFYNIVIECDKQVQIKKDIQLPDEAFDVRLVGAIDFITKDRKIIYDAKRVSEWTDEKYDESVQHDFYLWAVPESEQFFYLVGSGPKWVSDEYFQVEYAKPTSEELSNRCTNVIVSFLKYLKDNNLMNIYKENYGTKSKSKK